MRTGPHKALESNSKRPSSLTKNKIALWIFINHQQNSADSSSFRKEQSVEIIVTLVALSIGEKYKHFVIKIIQLDGSFVFTTTNITKIIKLSLIIHMLNSLYRKLE